MPRGRSLNGRSRLCQGSEASSVPERPAAGEDQQVVGRSVELETKALAR